jgi:uncharacterized LabA/DUF88 family protein
MSENPRRFALFIDGDNVPVPLVPHVLERLNKYRRPIVRKVFLSKPSGTQWEKVIHAYSLEPVWVPSNISGKNASDIALVIDAIELLYQQPDITGYCILSSDSDFTRLATYLVGKNKFVLGIGEAKTPKSFVQACSKFVYIRELLQPKNNALQASEQSGDSAFKTLLQAYENCSQDANGRVPLTSIGMEMVALNPEFKSGDYPDLRQVAQTVKALAMSYPDGIIKIAKKTESKQAVYYVCMDYIAVKFIEAYKRLPKDKDSWVQLSSIGAELKKDSAFAKGFNYRGTKYRQLLKFVKRIEKAYPQWITIGGDGKSASHVVRVYLR